MRASEQEPSPLIVYVLAANAMALVALAYGARVAWRWAR